MPPARKATVANPTTRGRSQRDAEAPAAAPSATRPPAAKRARLSAASPCGRPIDVSALTWEELTTSRSFLAELAKIHERDELRTYIRGCQADEPEKHRLIMANQQAFDDLLAECNGDAELERAEAAAADATAAADAAKGARVDASPLSGQPVTSTAKPAAKPATKPAPAKPAANACLGKGANTSIGAARAARAAKKARRQQQTSAAREAMAAKACSSIEGSHATTTAKSRKRGRGS
jgi:hypothetical protein